MRWYAIKDFDLTLEAMQKVTNFYYDKKIDMLRFACTLPNLDNICPLKFTDAKCNPFRETDKSVLEKYREDVAGGPSIVFARKAFVNETSIRKSTNLCKTNVAT